MVRWSFQIYICFRYKERGIFLFFKFETYFFISNLNLVSSIDKIDTK